ncbi:Abi family protein [Paenibacillus dauci]|uniref:Abi family protein n=1 Tax=Paenibacillus dauci TaxID=1567106 RepID=UPI000619C2B5|nr:Abi family protein [Paenibacillus dauci]
MKPFKTYRQQISILRSRGLQIQNGSKAMRVLERENYYSLINGYKDLFLILDVRGKPVSPEQYKNGTTFEEIHSLFCFDRELRNILLEALLKFEASIKTKISYRFTAKHKEANAYIEMTNYSRDPVKLKTVLGVIATLSNELSRKSTKTGPIKHYLDNHDGVPFWVLVGYLTLGNIQYFYDSIDDSLRNTIAQDFAKSYNRDYAATIHFTADELQNVLKAATYFRNVCAHEERLYSFKMNKPPRSSMSAGQLGISVTLLNHGNLFMMIALLKLVSAKKDFNLLLNKVSKLFDLYEASFNSLSFKDVQNKMGFPDDWKSVL